jgi:hypothetical protein
MASFDGVNRREFFRQAGAAGLIGTAMGMPELAFAQAAGQAGNITHEVAQPTAEQTAAPTESVNFAVCGMSHDHIYGMVDAVKRGGVSRRLIPMRSRRRAKRRY